MGIKKNMEPGKEPKGNIFYDRKLMIKPCMESILMVSSSQEFL